MITIIANTIQEYLSAEGYIVSSSISHTVSGPPDIITYVRTMQDVRCCTIIYSEQGLKLVPATWYTYADKVIEYAHPDLIMNLILTINQYKSIQQSNPACDDKFGPYDPTCDDKFRPFGWQPF